MDAVIRDDRDGADSPAQRGGRFRFRSFFDHWIFDGDPRRGGTGVAVSGLLILVYVVYFAHVTTATYRGFGYRTFDLAFYDQGVWLLSRFHAPYLTTVGRDLFGDHAQYSLFVLAPLYWIRPDASTLLNVQALVMGAGAIPVYMLAIRRSLGPVLATVFVAAFLLHPALGQTNLENYHPDSFLIPILGFAIYAAVEKRSRMFVVCCILALLCKEDVVVVVAPLAAWYWWRRDRRIGALIAGVSILAAIVDTAVVMRSLVGVSTRNAYRIPFSACVGRACSVSRHVSDFAREIVTKPAAVVRYLVAGDRPNGRPFYVWQMIAPSGLTFLVAPEVAATVVLALAVNVFSTVGYQHQIAYHYSMVLLPGLAMGSVYAVSRLERARRAIAGGLVGVCALGCAYLWGPLPFARHSRSTQGSQSSAVVADVNRVIAQLPPNAVVAADDSFVTHVDRRERVYLWPTPFSASHWGVSTKEGQRLPEADDVEYLLLPPVLHDHVAVFASIRAGFVEVARADNGRGQGVVLYRKIGSG